MKAVALVRPHVIEMLDSRLPIEPLGDRYQNQEAKNR
jgi:hypothetical protein